MKIDINGAVLEPNDQVMFADGGITTIRSFEGNLIHHTGGFCSCEKPMKLVQKGTKPQKLYMVQMIGNIPEVHGPFDNEVDRIECAQNKITTDLQSSFFKLNIDSSGIPSVDIFKPAEIVIQ